MIFFNFTKVTDFTTEIKTVQLDEFGQMFTP